MRRHLTLIAALVTSAGLVGCTDAPTTPATPDAHPTPAATTTMAPTVSASPTPEPTPTVARSRDTAEKFIRDYFGAYEEGLRQGTPEPVRGLAADTCQLCVAIIDGLEKLAAEGTRYAGARIDAVPFFSELDSSREVMRWKVAYESRLGDLTDANGTPLATEDLTRVEMRLELTYADGQWLLTELDNGVR